MACKQGYTAYVPVPTEYLRRDAACMQEQIADVDFAIRLTIGQREEVGYPS
ncbi:uncharacterized protein RAG0_06903 [Rhynchosporium agropyri]|uniref:Uncharacterized protein n=1 Tax=Rhynchosporium agropyri TaxID=914238 RepID=A0A1E1KMB8_9HELO|nr:uncharacterized protein RAG0_06903 [Rhynchosporium agropyri]